MVCSGSKSNIWLIIFTNIKKSCPFIASHHLSFWFTKHKLVLLRARTWWPSIQLLEGMFKFPPPASFLDTDSNREIESRPGEANNEYAAVVFNCNYCENSAKRRWL
jgi:hypothetical protein